MGKPAAFLSAVMSIACSLSGCSDLGGHLDCPGHRNAETWCEGSTIMQCRQGGAYAMGVCDPNICFDGLGAAACVLPGETCPTDRLGYQCLGEHRVTCLSNGMVANEGTCWPPTDEQVSLGEGPYCVENPGGDVLPCGWKREKCTDEGEVHCFEDGSAVCRRGVYQRFLPNNKASQATCIPTPLADCWGGRTWCEGDVLKRCDRCADERTCASVTIEATCGNGACVAYPRPAWMVEIAGKSDTLFGCVIDGFTCASPSTMTCANGATATCLPDGRAVVGLSCSEVQLFLGGPSLGGSGTKYGPVCVERSEKADAICAYDSAPCANGTSRCAETDGSTPSIERCQDGIWLFRRTCVSTENGTTTCQMGPSGGCK